MPTEAGNYRQHTAAPATVLAVLLQRHNLHRYGVFKARYEQVAREVDRALVGRSPSRAQWHRWMNGDIKRLPYVHHCRVLEAMLPGWRADQLFAPSTSMTGPEVFSQDTESPSSEASAGAGHRRKSIAGPHSGVIAMFASRTEFTSRYSPIDLFENATTIRAAGLSLNLLTQQYADRRLRELVGSGTIIECLFLDPDGSAVEQREREEAIAPGYLSTLTKINIDMMQSFRQNLLDDAGGRITIGVYDQTIRFNLMIIDDNLCVAQPYLPRMRGVDSPTMVIERSGQESGLFQTFERLYQWTREQSRLL